MLTNFGQAPVGGSCLGWEGDPESFSKRVAEHYVRTVLGQSLSAKRIVPYYPSGDKKFMEVQFSPTLAVGVSFVKIPDYVIALRLRAQPPGPPRYYTYSCTPDGNLVLRERPKPSVPQVPTSLRMRGLLGGAERTAGWLGEPANRDMARTKPALWSSPPYLRFGNLDRFDYNKSSLTNRLMGMVNNLATAVTLSWETTQPITTVRLVGHTDSTGDEKYNSGLGDRRTQAVRDELLNKLRGLAGKVLIVVEPSPGESKPVADNRTSDGRAHNRRVEVFIMSGPVSQPSPGSPPKPQIDVRKESEKAAQKIEEEAERRRQQQRYNHPIPAPRSRGKSLSQWLDEVLAPLPGWVARRIRSAVISGSCYGLEVLLTQAGGRLGDRQKEEIRKQCEEAAKKPIR